MIYNPAYEDDTLPRAMLLRLPCFDRGNPAYDFVKDRAVRLVEANIWHAVTCISEYKEDDVSVRPLSLKICTADPPDLLLKMVALFTYI